MADPIQTAVQSQDIPEYLRDYRSALLNAAFQSVFSKPFLQQNFPGATWYTAGQQAPATAAPSGATAGGDTRTDTQVPEDGTAKSASANKIANALAMVSGQMPKMLGMVWDPKTRTYIPEAYKNIATKGLAKGGPTSANNGTTEDIIRAYEELRKSMPVGLLPDIYGAEGAKSTLTGSVVYPGRRNPFGAYRPPSATSGYSVGTDFQSTPITYNPVVSIGPGVPVNVGSVVSGTGGGYGPLPGGGTGGTGGGGTGGGAVGGGGGTGVTGGRGGGGVGGGGATGGGSGAGGVSGAPPIGTPASAAVLPVYASGAAGTTEANRGAGGYNPAQYATDQQASGLASLLGGQVARTNVVGPVAPPPQNLIDFGDGAQLNAGLVQQALGNITVDGVSRARTPSEMTQSLAGLRAEIAAGGGDTSQIDRLIQQNTQAYASGAATSPIGQPPAPSTPQQSKQDWAQGLVQSGKQNPFAPGASVSATGEGSASVANPAMSAISRGASDMVDLLRQINEGQGKSAPSFGVQVDKGTGITTTARNAQEEDEWVRKNAEGYAGGGTLAQFDIGDDGKVRNYSRDGAIRKQFGGGFPPKQGATPSDTYYSSIGFGDASTGSGIFGFSSAAPMDDGGSLGKGSTMQPKPYNIAGGRALPAIGKSAPTSAGESSNTPGPTVQQQASPGPNLLGVGTMQTPIAGGFGGTGGLSSLFGAVNPGTPAQGLFNPPPVYGGQRILGFGQDFGQYTPGTGFTTSRLTNQALFGAGALPSVFAEVQDPNTKEWSTQISPYGDFGKGVANINYATDIAGDIASYGRSLAQQVGQQGQLPSYLMTMMPGIQEMGFTSPITATEIDPATGKPKPLVAPDMKLPVGVTAPDLKFFQMDPAQAVASERTSVNAFGRPQSEQYMSPYQEAVTEAQKRDAVRQANMLKAGRSAAAVRAGAFGGSRQAIQEGMAEEALQRQLGDIEATGRQKAYESAQAQFERDRAASLASQQSNVQAALQAALANQQAGLASGRENLGARLGVQNLAAQQALQAQLANQQAGLTVDQANLQSALATQQLGIQSGLEAAKASQSGDLATWQMQLDAIKQASAEQEAARQRDFSNRLAALQQAQSGAAGLAGLGGTMMGIPGMAQQLELQRLAAMQQAGGAIDARTEAALNMAYQDFINQQNFPYQQMNFLTGIMNQIPTGMQVEGVQFQRPDTAGGLASLAGSIPGLISAIRNK